MVHQDYTVDTVAIGAEKLSLVSACKRVGGDKRETGNTTPKRRERFRTPE